MPEITSIVPQVKDKNRYSIFIDGRFYCGLTLEAAVKYHLKVGMAVDKQLLDNIQLETDKNTAMDKALTHLSATRKTQKQITDFLNKKGYTQAVCDYVIEKLRYYGFVDDLAYCRAYVAECNGKGKRLIEADLMRRGANKEDIAAVLAEVEEDESEARAIAEKYLRGKEFTKENIYKAFKYLLSRGYGYDTAKAALDGLGEDEWK